MKDNISMANWFVYLDVISQLFSIKQLKGNKMGRNASLNWFKARISHLYKLKGKKATDIIIIFICSAAKSDPLRDTHIVTQKWNRYMCIPAELLQSGMVAK